MSKKRQLFNTFKGKSIKEKPRFGIVVITTFNNFYNKLLQTSTFISTFNIVIVDIAIIDADAYYAACKLKGTEIFVFSIKDLEFQIAKEAKSENDPKSVVLKEYHYNDVGK